MLVGFPLKRPAGGGMSWLNRLSGGAESYSLGMLQTLLGIEVKTLPPGWQCHHISPAALCVNHAAGTRDDTQTHRQLVHVHHYSAALSEEVPLITFLNFLIAWDHTFKEFTLNSMSCSVLK